MNKTIRSMTDSGPWTSIFFPMSTQMISSEPLVIMWCSLCIVILHKTSTISVSCWVITMLTIVKSSLLVLFFFLIIVFRHPRDEVTCVWPDNDWCHHIERALRISLHRRRTKSHSQAIWPPVKLSDEPVSCRYDHHVTNDFWATQKTTVWYCDILMV